VTQVRLDAIRVRGPVGPQAPGEGPSRRRKTGAGETKEKMSLQHQSQFSRQGHRRPMVLVSVGGEHRCHGPWELVSPRPPFICWPRAGPHPMARTLMDAISCDPHAPARFRRLEPGSERDAGVMLICAAW